MIGDSNNERRAFCYPDKYLQTISDCSVTELTLFYLPASVICRPEADVRAMVFIGGDIRSLPELPYTDSGATPQMDVGWLISGTHPPAMRLIIFAPGILSFGEYA